MVFREWALPAPLEGVKSRKRQIFQVREGAELPLAEGTSTVSGGVGLTLASRVAAAGEAGHALTAVLLGERTLPDGQAFHNDGLRVAHLGPHLCRARAATADAYAAAVAASLELQPQVVVLDEAPGLGGRAWAGMFRTLLRSAALRGFRGAVVVRAAAETPAVRRVCAEHWAVVGGQLWQLETAGADPETGESEAEDDAEAESAALLDVESHRPLSCAAPSLL